MLDSEISPWVLFESIPEMVVVVDTEGVILYANEHCEEIVGWASPELVGKPIETLIPRRLQGGHRAHRKGYTDDPKARPMGSGLLLTAQHRDGGEVSVEIALSPLSGEIGEVAATVATVRDISERLETAAKLVDAQTKLEVLDDRDRIARELHDSVIQRLFAAGLHLQASSGRTDIADRVSVVVDEIDEAIREIRGAIFTLHRPARLDSGLEAALRASINEAARMLGHRPTLRLGGMLGSIPPELGTELVAVLRETLMNVAKHAEATKTEVSLDVGTDEVTLVVLDDGLGMAATDGDHNGGLGLRNIRERAARLSGEVQFSEVEPHGTQILWIVPRHPAATVA